MHCYRPRQCFRQTLIVTCDANREDIGDELKAGCAPRCPSNVPAQIVCLSASRSRPTANSTARRCRNRLTAMIRCATQPQERCWLRSGLRAAVEQVGISDNFFELGGDSILSLHCFPRQDHPTYDDLKLRDLMRYQTIAASSNRAWRRRAVSNRRRPHASSE